MLLLQDLKYGVILVLGLVMRKQELYKVTINGKEAYTALTQGEYFDLMDDLSLEFYQTGSPHPDDIITETYLEELH